MMKLFFPSIALIFFLASSVFSQSVKPDAAPTPPADNDIVKISTTLIQIDNDRPDQTASCLDLKPEEIKFHKTQKKQEISNFSLFQTSNRHRKARSTDKTTRFPFRRPPFAPNRFDDIALSLTINSCRLKARTWFVER